MTSRSLPDVRVTVRLSLGVLVAVLLIARCAAPAQSQAPSDSATATPSARVTPIASAWTSTPTPIGESSASPSMFPGFEYSDILQVTVSGLAVRKAPVLGSGLLQGYLSSGDFVSVHLGPLPIGDAVWYLIWPAEDARLHYGTFPWVTTGLSEPGWVAASVGDEQYLILHRRPETSEIEEYLPVGLTLSGTGDYESAPQPRHDLFIFNWAVAPGDQASPCTFSVTLRPQDGIEPVVAVDTSTADVQQGPISGAGAIPNTPWGPSAGGSWDSFTMLIASGCTWTVGLHALHHD